MDNRIELKSYIRVIMKWRKLIFWNTFIIAVIAFIISLIIPKKYTATASLLPPLPGDALWSIETSMLGLRGIGLTGATPSDLFAAILKSHTVMDSVIKENNLMKAFKTKTLKDTYATLTKYTNINVAPEGVINIATTANTPILAKNIADSYIKNLDILNKTLVMSIGKRNRMFLERRLTEVQNDLKTIEDSLKKFQELHKTISIEDEIKPTLEAIADIKAQIVSNKIKLGMLREYATEENPEIVRLKSEIKELNNNLTNMEYKKDDSHFGIGFSVPLTDLPKVSLELARYIRDVKVQEKLLSLIIEQYELAKTQEIKDTPTVNILESPMIPERKSYPKRSIIVFFSLILSLCFSTTLAFCLNWLDNLSEVEKAEWQKVLGILPTNRRL